MIRSAVVAVALLQAAAAAAQDSPATAPPPRQTGSPSTHVHNYGAFDLTCLRWTDGCRTCSRGAAGETICPNIGIACQPAEVKCIAQKEESPQK